MENSLFPELKLTPVADRLTNSAYEIGTERGESMHSKYNHALMCQISFPRKKFEGVTFEQRSGRALLRVSAGHLWNGKEAVLQPVPYGSIPRLILVHISTEALRTDDPRVLIGDSLRQFMRKLGNDLNGRAYSEFHKQMNATAACRLWLGFNQENKLITIDSKPIEIFEVWNSGTDDHKSLHPGYAQLSLSYFQSLKAHAVPLDMRALSSLRHSSLALDVYMWLSYRLTQLDNPLNISWESLKNQFGSEFHGIDALHNFRTKFNKALDQVLTVYRGAKVTSSKFGLILYPSHPPIRKIQSQVI